MSLKITSPFSRFTKAKYPVSVIDQINDYLDTLDHTWKAGTSYNKEVFAANEKYRYCQLSWVKDKYLKDFVFKQFLHANKSGMWNFDIDGMEDIQYTVYDENNHYDWHSDHFIESDRCRKLSMSLMLGQIGEDYTGGEFEYRYLSGPDVITDTYPLNKGEAIVFSSQLHHRVTPVTSGVRRVLVAWAWGPMHT